MAKLTGKVAVVTGASKGIGASIAEHFGAEGASVVVNYASSKAGADKVVDKITSKGGKAIAVQGDVSKPADVTRLFDETKKQYGKLDVLVNNAGVYVFAPLLEITPEHFHKHFDLNVLGVVLATQEAVKLIGPEGGSILNISSVVSRIAAPGASVYSATKAALDSLTRIYAQELGSKKIRVNSLNPGLIETEGTAGFIGTDFSKDIEAKTPLGRIGNPEDIAKVAVFYASDDSYWINGQEIDINGGARQ